MLIKIDSRESQLLSICNALIEFNDLGSKISVVTEQMPIGDIAICDGDSTILLIERKSIHDLAASINDGRYNEQSFRLNECSIPNHNIMYLIEGNLQQFTPKWGKIDRTALYSSIVSLQCYKGFSIIRSNNINESAEYIIRFANKINKVGIDKLFTSTNGEIGKNYTQVLKQKKDFVNKDNIHEMWLSQIPGVSSKVAEIIMKRYKNIWDLRNALIESPNAIDDVKQETQTGKMRSIGKNTISAIKNYVLDE